MFSRSKREIVVRRVVIKRLKKLQIKHGGKFNRRELIDTILLFSNPNDVGII